MLRLKMYVAMKTWSSADSAHIALATQQMPIVIGSWLSQVARLWTAMHGQPIGERGYPDLEHILLCEETAMYRNEYADGQHHFADSALRRRIILSNLPTQKKEHLLRFAHYRQQYAAHKEAEAQEALGCSALFRSDRGWPAPCIVEQKQNMHARTDECPTTPSTFKHPSRKGRTIAVSYWTDQPILSIVEQPFYAPLLRRSYLDTLAFQEFPFRRYGYKERSRIEVRSYQSDPWCLLIGSYGTPALSSMNRPSSTTDDEGYAHSSLCALRKEMIPKDRQSNGIAYQSDVTAFCHYRYAKLHAHERIVICEA